MKIKNCAGCLKKNYKFIAFQTLLHWLPDDIDMTKKLTKTKNILAYLLFFCWICNKFLITKLLTPLGKPF